MSATKIGWIGLGRMGIPMSQQLIKAGYGVSVFNRTKSGEEALKAVGATAASPPAELLEQSDVVIVMVSNDQAIREIFAGEDGLLSAKVVDKIVVNMSTVSPGISMEMAALCKDRSNHYIDAPVSGSVKQAEEGQLVIMAGGGEIIFLRGKTILEKLGKLSNRVGATR